MSDRERTMANIEKKRRVRANSETIRERLEKRQSETNKPAEKEPGVLSALWSGFTWPLRQIARPFKWLGRFLGRYKAFRIIGLIFLPRYVRSSWKELRLVTWPDRPTSWKLTYAVIVFSIIFGVIVFAVDFVLDKLFKEIIVK